MSQAAIELKGIACTFVSDDSGTLSTYTAVKNVDLTVADGEFVSVVGPTGCGKSTLLNMSAGLLEPSAGTVSIFGEPLVGLNRRAGYMFQADSLMPWKSALDNVERYAKQAELQTSVRLYNTDSLEGVMKLLPSLPKDSFIHIDPYEIDKKGTSGLTYLDILIEATQLGMKCLLWYGFMTQHDKSHLNSYITTRLEEARIKDYICAELIMSSIRQDTVLYNPGIIGSGILGTNLSQKSNTAILDYSDILVRLYQYAKYKDHDGSLYRDIIGNPPET